MVPWRARRAVSCASTQTQWASTARGPAIPTESRYAISSSPVVRSTVSRSTMVSAACVCSWASNRSASSLAARSSGPEQLGTKRGAKHTRSRPPAPLCHRLASASASESAASVDSASSSGAPSGCASMRHLPTTPRIPTRSTALKAAPVWRTVSMSRIAVVPPRSSSAAPSAADQYTVSSVCAASSGQMRRTSQSSSRKSSASPRNSV